MNKMNIFEIFHYFFTNHNNIQLSQSTALTSSRMLKKYGKVISSTIISLPSLISPSQTCSSTTSSSPCKYNPTYRDYQKMKSSSCEIGKYEAYLMSDFEKYLLGCVASIAKERYIKLVKSIHVFYLLNLNEDVQLPEIIVHLDFSNSQRESQKQDDMMMKESRGQVFQFFWFLILGGTIMIGSQLALPILIQWPSFVFHPIFFYLAGLMITFDRW